MKEATTYPNSKPCPENKIVHAVGSDKKRTIYVCFVEDRVYRKNEVMSVLSDTTGLSSGESEKLFEAIKAFFAECSNTIISVLKRLYGSKTPIDISLPRVSTDIIRPGEFPGNFVVYGEPRLVLHVEPKVGWHAYSKMVNETKASLVTIVAETGVIEPFLGNLYYPFSSTPISYSLLLIKLTDHILTSTPPKRVVRLHFTSESEVGKPYIPGSLKYTFQGLPFGVFERARVESQLYPFMLLAKFHYHLALVLGSIEEYIIKLGAPTVLLTLITSALRLLRSVHLNYLTMHPIAEALQAVQHVNISDTELVAETLKAARINPYFRVLAELYEAYSSDIGLINVYIRRGLILPVASSKVYELWVLSKLVEFLRNSKHVQRVNIKKHKDFFAELDLGLVKIAYNEPLEGVFVKHLAGSYLRPDFVLEHGGNVVVYDAKYKRKLSISDVVRLLAYIAEFAEPIDMDNVKYLIGGFYKLKGKNRDVYIRDRNMPIKIGIYTYTLDPSLDDRIIAENVKKSLEVLMKP